MMTKKKPIKKKEPIKTCDDCIHEYACRMWTDGRYISDESASRCPNHTTVKNSAAYLLGVLDERERKETNADRLRKMSDEELADKITDHINACPVDVFTDCKVDCKACWLNWLKKPYEENTDE